MTVSVIVGGQFGDEGKGKVVSYLALKDSPVATVRGGVGPNAGHTVVHEGRTLKLRMLPSAMINPKTRLMLGAGLIVNPNVLLDEISEFSIGDRVVIDRQCAIIEEKHRKLDGEGHLRERIGTTGTGTGPANADRVLRQCKLARDVQSLSPYLGDVALEVNMLVDRSETVMVEGTQGTFLSLYHGTYPYVTSKDVTASAICSDVGLGPKKIDEVIVVFKSYVTRVGGGPLEKELSDGEAQRRGWREVATVTGRARRAAPFNMDLAKRAVMLNSATQIALTKLDLICPECASVRSYRTLPREAREFVEELENEVKVPVTLISMGPESYQIIDRRKE